MGQKPPDWDWTIPEMPDIFRDEDETPPPTADTGGQAKNPTFEEPEIAPPLTPEVPQLLVQGNNQVDWPPPEHEPILPAVQPARRRTPRWIIPVVLIAVALIGTGVATAYLYNPSDIASPQESVAAPTDPSAIISYAERWTGVNHNSPSTTESGAPQVTLVGFTGDGREIDIYHFSSYTHTYRESGGKLYVMECNSSATTATIFSVSVDAESGGYTSTLLMKLHICPDQFTVVNHKAYYLTEMYSTELVEHDLAPEGTPKNLNIALTLCPDLTSDSASIFSLIATDDALVYECVDMYYDFDYALYAYNIETRSSTIIARDGFAEAVLSHQVLYSVETWEEDAYVEYFSYDTITKDSTLIGRGVTQKHFSDSSTYSAGGGIVPINTDYVYGAMWLDNNDDTQVDLYNASGESNPELLVTLNNVCPNAFDMAIVPVSANKLFASVTTWDSQGDTEGATLYIVNLQGELLDTTSAPVGSPHQVSYVNVQYPRFSA
jgi:hypothetical protein